MAGRGELFPFEPAPVQFFDRGIEFVAGLHLPASRTAVVDDRSRVLVEWPEFCLDVGLAVGNTEGNKWVPRLVDWYRSDGFEVFEVEMRGRFAKHVELLAEVLLSCRAAMSESTIEVRPGVVRVVLNHTELRDVLRFDQARIPLSSDEVYLGQTSLGGPLVWDLRDKYHGVIVGEAGSGKTEAAALVLTQLHLKGWGLTILTPTVNDSAFQAFADVGHAVIAGADPIDIAAARKTAECLLAEMIERERSRGQAGDDWYSGQPQIVGVDESGDWLEDRKEDPNQVRRDKAVIRRVMDLIARRGRKVRMHLLVLTQEPYIHNFGTPETLRQLSFRLAITKLDRIFHGTIFQPSGEKISPNVARVLSNPMTPKGRGIARGYKPTTSVFGAPVDDIPVQVAWCPADHRAVLLAPPDAGLGVVA